MLGTTEQIHLVGIGGIGMSGIAEILLNLGYRGVGFGSARQRNHPQPGRIGRADLHRSRRQVRRGGRRGGDQQRHPRQQPGIDRRPRSQDPGDSAGRDARRIDADEKYPIAVAGSHGKTTTTSLLATVLGAAGFDPTVVVGGRVDSIGSNAKLGAGDTFVTEADESDGSFLLLDPMLAVVTNIDLEHLDHYSGLEHLKRTFLEFINRVPFYA